MSDITKRDAEILMRLVDAEIKRICEETANADQQSIEWCEAVYALDSTGSRP